ncbi:hypothetical protein O181_074996 [Austropuccinia psidii MF-1]|uniref:C3H1-type domain-containing protein n=1 Tax=Austropuccinia psidii MF-1 TaxID=1389203 RepID=A0A9Q3FDV0_9BASI|nr:hypothetical protein [Austropuccinia psidii MF-1]
MTSQEHQNVLDRLSILKCKIEEQKKNLNFQSKSINQQHQQEQASDRPLDQESYLPDRHKLIPGESSNDQDLTTALNLKNLAPVRNVVPLITKTSWKSSHPFNPHHQQKTFQINSNPNSSHYHLRGSTKLILNKPAITKSKPQLSPSTSINPSPSPWTTNSNNHNIPANDLSINQPISSIEPNQTLNPPSDPPNLKLANPSNPSSSASSNSISSPNRILSPSNSNLNQQPATDPLPSSIPQSNELIIDGVSFSRDSGGKKLIRKNTNSTLPSINSSSSQIKPTPIKTSIGETTYVRTKSGNLIQLSALKKFQAQKLHEIKRARLIALTNNLKSYKTPNALHPNWNPSKSKISNLKVKKIIRPPLMKKNEQCRYFAKTGACRNGLTCVYQHDPSQVAICPRFLRNKCPHSANSCPLSHKPNPHNMEHCSHFPRCNKPDCPYPHLKPTSPQICKDFADIGWCFKGSDCSERHVRECPEFSSKGTCSNPSCRLRHMINRNQNDTNDDDEDHDEIDNDALHSACSDEDGGSLFFTDLKGKRKTNDMPLGQTSQLISHHPHRAYKGISHNSELDPPTKRLKYDAMAHNEDFVMFLSSDEEKEQAHEEEEEDDDDDEGEEKKKKKKMMMMEKNKRNRKKKQRIRMIKMPVVLIARSICLPTITQAYSQIALHHPSKIRKRSDLEPGEEIEEGEIFDEDEGVEDRVQLEDKKTCQVRGQEDQSKKKRIISIEPVDHVIEEDLCDQLEKHIAETVEQERFEEDGDNQTEQEEGEELEDKSRPCWDANFTNNSDSFMESDEASSDSDESIARQLLGHRSSSTLPSSLFLRTTNASSNHLFWGINKKNLRKKEAEIKISLEQKR